MPLGKDTQTVPKLVQDWYVGDSAIGMPSVKELEAEAPWNKTEWRGSVDEMKRPWEYKEKCRLGGIINTIESLEGSVGHSTIVEKLESVRRYKKWCLQTLGRKLKEGKIVASTDSGVLSVRLPDGSFFD